MWKYPLNGEQGCTAILADRMPLISQALTRMLVNEFGVQVMATANDFEMAATAARSIQPSIIIMDIELLGDNWRHSVRIIKACAPNAKLLLTLAQPTDRDFVLALAAGADRCISKTASISTIKSMIWRVLESQQNVEAHLRQGCA